MLQVVFQLLPRIHSHTINGQLYWISPGVASLNARTIPRKPRIITDKIFIWIRQRHNRLFFLINFSHLPYSQVTVSLLNTKGLLCITNTPRNPEYQIVRKIDLVVLLNMSSLRQENNRLAPLENPLELICW